MNLLDKVAVVTGGASGIGLATAHLLVNAGARVVLADANMDAGSAAERELRATGGDVRYVHTDVGDLDSVESLFAFVSEQHGGLDILFNNAGILGGARFPESEPAAWRRVVQVNVVGVLNCVHAAFPLLKQRGSSVIVNTASTAGLKSSHLDPAYAMTKGGVVTLTRSLTFLKDEFGIRVNCVCPSLVKTGLASNSSSLMSSNELHAFKELRGNRGERPALSADDVAKAVIHLLQEEDLNGYCCEVVMDEPWRLIPPVAPQRV